MGYYGELKRREAGARVLVLVLAAMPKLRFIATALDSISLISNLIQIYRKMLYDKSKYIILQYFDCLP